MYFQLWVVYQDDTGAGAGLGSSTASVNRYIQQLAQEYSGDCKTSFDELSKIIQVGIPFSYINLSFEEWKKTLFSILFIYFLRSFLLS